MEENSDEETPINVDFVFIFKSEKGSEGFRQKLISTSFNYPVLCDPAGEFEKNNTLPKNELYHVFLLDQDNKIVLSGSPIYNPGLWNLYESKIASL
ncbi:MAG: hypothetical protein LBV18_02850 [Alistipes sp.]|jgi:hypothetical protein|nr:hypothetical protein [Alistipes sp.]